MEPGIPIRRFVDVRPHPTVVRLADLEGAGAQWISESYVLTAEVGEHLQVLRRLLSAKDGRGIFLVGHYGSGKSHFFGYLAQQLTSGRFVPEAPTLAAISLVNFRAEARLEDIVTAALGFQSDDHDRRLGWSALLARHPHGFMLLLDELSEFLRSKADHRSFNEDVRFLQFMGEWAQGHPFWILAAMQEQIEHTGDLEVALYRKIKDRFPIRFFLTPSHVRDLLSESILVKKPGYAAAVAELATELRHAFPDNPLEDGVLASIYPVHPVTLELLEEIRDRFSQTRGVVDFTVTQLAGNAVRGVEPFLDRPWGSLITPDAIVAHFRDLFETQPEFVPLAQQLFPYYEKHLQRLFPNDAQHALARRVLNLLVLIHLSPVRDGLSAEDAAYWLLFTATRIDPATNLRIIGRILERLADEGRYLKASGGRYYLDLRDEGREGLERLLLREIGELQGVGDAVFEELLPLLPDDGFNPFVLRRDEWVERRVTWHFHERCVSVYLGNETPPPPRDRLALCVRLPWGEGKPAPGVYTIQPRALELGQDTLELAAMVRLRGRALHRELATRLAKRMEERVALFQKQIKTAYLDVTWLGPTGNPIGPPTLETTLSFNAWFERFAEQTLGRAYPSFERCAPSYGPLPKEAHRRFMRFASEHDLADEAGDEYVDLIREAYLLPMGLMTRQGRGYEVARNLHRNELVGLVLPLLEHHPTPKVVYDHLAEPVYGLVPDQCHLLLSFLVVQGALDILKGNRSYRDFHETLTSPLQYDRIVPAHTLSLEEVRQLEQLCQGLGIRLPKQWTVFTQRRAVEQLRERARRDTEEFQRLFLKLQQTEQGPELQRTLGRMLGQWDALRSGDNDLPSLQHFLREIGSVGRFLSMVGELRELPARIDRLLLEIGRFQYLLSHPALERFDDDAAERLRSLAAPPALDEPGALEGWLDRARALHGAYVTAYRGRHDARQAADAQHAIWRWQAPPLARSKSLALGDILEEMAACRQRAERLRCRGLSGLEFQPICTCGFDGETAPIDTELSTFAGLRDTIEREIESFFRQDSVRTRVVEWQTQGLPVTELTRDYLAGRVSTPEIVDLELFDRHMAGLELVKDVEVEPVLELLTERTWERQDLGRAFERLLASFGADRIRFRTGEPSSRDLLLQWGAEQTLRHGVPLPKGLAAKDLGQVSAAMRPEWVGPVALAHPDELGLNDAGVQQLVRWLVEGRLDQPSREGASSLVLAALEIVDPTRPSSPEDLRRLSQCLYRHHSLMMRAAGERWRARLEALATVELACMPEGIVDALKARLQAQWVVIDCLGLPLLGVVLESLDTLFPDRRLVMAGFAQVPPPTTSDAFNHALVEGGIRHAFEKVNVVDELIHERFLSLDDLGRIALAELRASARRLRGRLDPAEPVLVFADHGFRIATDGRSYQHGGRSTLERVVPVLYLEPAG